MSTNPTFLTRLRANLGGEVSAQTLEALRAAGVPALSLLVDAESRRAELARQGADAWKFDPATGGFFISAWVAYVLQTLGDAFLAADYAANPKTVGFVPRVTADQILSFYSDVEAWLTRARQAEQNTGFQLDVRVPAVLSAWVEVEPCPMAHLHAMLSACGSIIEQAEIAVVSDLSKLGGAEHPDDMGGLNAELTAAKTKFEFATSLHAQLHGGQATRDMHDRVEKFVKEAIEVAFRVGQLAAMPSLVGQPYVPTGSRGVGGPRQPGYGQPGFDPWGLTNPSNRAKWQRDAAAVRAVDALWRSDPDPAATLAIQAEIDGAERDGTVERNGQGDFYCCPWGSIYRALDPVTIGGRRIRRGETFTFEVSAEEMEKGGKFKREILVANFAPTDSIDYCNPEEGGHDD